MADARRYKCALEVYPSLQCAEAAALALPAFRDTAPERRPDAFLAARSRASEAASEILDIVTQVTLFLRLPA
jgi:hypothetical protein